MRRPTTPSAASQVAFRLVGSHKSQRPRRLPFFYRRRRVGDLFVWQTRRTTSISPKKLFEGKKLKSLYAPLSVLILFRRRVYGPTPYLSYWRGEEGGVGISRPQSVCGETHRKLSLLRPEDFYAAWSAAVRTLRETRMGMFPVAPLPFVLGCAVGVWLQQVSKWCLELARGCISPSHLKTPQTGELAGRARKKDARDTRLQGSCLHCPRPRTGRSGP